MHVTVLTPLFVLIYLTASGIAAPTPSVVERDGPGFLPPLTKEARDGPGFLPPLTKEARDGPGFLPPLEKEM